MLPLVLLQHLATALQIQIAENWNMVGMRATESHDLVLNDVWVPKDFS